jgi:outer membrane receptor protein involved in Fe transport
MSVVKSIKKAIAATLGLLALSLLLNGVSLGQIKSGVITGTVTDPTGAVIAGANVSVVNMETNVATTAVTDETGSFTVPYLAPGSYAVNVEKAGSGFSKYVRTNIIVSTAQTVKVEVKLQAGVTTDTVSVQADAAELQTSSATVQSAVNQLAVESLPNITHNPFSYAALQAGVVPRGLFGNTQNTTSFGIGIDGRRQASAVGINGGAAFSNDIILDGVSIQGSAWNETAVLPNQDALQEVKVVTNNYSAEYGRAQGVVIFTTKGGSNEFHGSGFYRLRNEALNANSFFNNANNIARGPFKSNTFGGAVGGRIIRDKAFFFVSYEGLRFHKAYDYLLTVPTAAERQGDFSNTYVSVSGRAVPIKLFDPFNATRVGTSSVFTRAQFPTFTDAQGVVRTSPLPQARLDKFGLAILNSYPLPNRTPDDIFNRNNFFLRGNQEFTKNNINSRLDYRWRNHSFYGTYGFQKGNILTPRSWGEDNPYYSRKEFVGNHQPDDNYYVALGDTVALSPSLILDARLGVNRIKADNEADAFDDYNYDQFGIPKEIQAINAIPGAPPQFAPSGTVSNLNNGTSLHKRERQTNTDFNASMTWTRGRWTHKFGGTYRVLLSNYIDVDDSVQIQTGPEFTRSNINADGSTTGLGTPDVSIGGLSIASILLGAGNLRVSPGFAIRLALAQKYYGIYTQNDWRATDRLTFNLGLRWDVQPGPTERYNRLSSIDLNSKEPLFGTPGAIIFPGNTVSRRNLWQTGYKNFGPRLGAAYQLTNSIVMRGGYGITYVPSNTGFNDGPGFYGAASFTSSVTGNAYGSSPAGVVIAPFYSSAVNPILAPVGPNTQDPGIYGGARRFPYDYKNGYVQQWNFFLEQKLGPNWIVSAGYIGSHGSRLQVTFVPINSAQLVDQQLLTSWRNTYIASNGTNPSTQSVCNPFQTLQTCVSKSDGTFGSATGPLIPYANGNIRNRSITRLEAAFPYPLEGDNIHLSSGVSDYNALQLQVTRQFAGGLQMSAHYTWSKQMATNRYNAQTNQGYADGGEINYFSNLRPDLQRLNRKITTNDIPHRVVANWVYDLPIGKGSRFDLKQPVLNAVGGGWRVAGSFTAQSGFVFPISNGGTNSINGLPDRVLGVPLEVPKELQRWYDGNTQVTLPSGRVIKPCKGCFLKYNIDAFAGRTVTTPNGTVVPDLFWYGTSAATFGDMRSNSTWNVNMSLEKSFKMWERYSVNLAAQATNLFNNTQFKPGLNTSFGATVLQSTVDANKSLNLKVGQLLDTPTNSTSTWGTYTQNTYDARQLELVMRIRF